MQEIYFKGQYFKTLLETEREGCHFMLLESIYNRSFSQMFELMHANREIDIQNLKKRGNYFLLWGPTEDPEFKCHGLTSLSGPKGGKRQFKNVVKTFFELVENSEHQGFKFTDQRPEYARIN